MKQSEIIRPQVFGFSIQTVHKLIIGNVAYKNGFTVFFSLSASMASVVTAVIVGTAQELWIIKYVFN